MLYYLIGTVGVLSIAIATAMVALFLLVHLKASAIVTAFAISIIFVVVTVFGLISMIRAVYSIHNPE
jgi:ABC-type multidrug transport system permease subunit